MIEINWDKSFGCYNQVVDSQSDEQPPSNLNKWNSHASQNFGDHPGIEITYISKVNPASSQQTTRKNEESTPSLTPRVLQKRSGRIGKFHSAAPVEKAIRPRKHRTAKSRRKAHNDSATRSRVRLNTGLEDLWKSIPENYKQLDSPICRAKKVEAACCYLRKLQAELDMLSNRNAE
jgi:hypothetical protein